MPSSICSSAFSQSELKRLADNANTFSALLSSMVTIPAVQSHETLLTCFDLAYGVSRGLEAIFAPNGNTVSPIAVAATLGDGAGAFAAISPPALSLSAVEADLIRAFRSLRRGDQEMMAGVVSDIAEAFPSRGSPILRLVSGGAA